MTVHEFGDRKNPVLMLFPGTRSCWACIRTTGARWSKKFAFRRRRRFDRALIELRNCALLAESAGSC
ncbi:hypothetical protein [Oscillospiraceae bacterium]|nr:hypothetical protein [Oscillospiraceae bacterium]